MKFRFFFLRSAIEDNQSVDLDTGIVTYRPIARQRLGKHIPAGANARNNRTSIARLRISKHTIDDVFSAWSVQADYKEVVDRVESSFETPAYRDMSFGAEELN
jgi:hypothetical protein